MRLIYSKTGSDGNCVIYENSNGKRLMVDSGVSVSEVNKNIGFSMSKVKNILITHHHQDHTKYILEYLERGIHVLTGSQTRAYLDIPEKYNYYITEIKPKELIVLDNEFYIKPFELPHINVDGTPCFNLGYLINSKTDKEKVLHCTDCQYIPYQFYGLDRIVIECNFISPQSYVSQQGYINEFVEQRRLVSHMSLFAVEEFLKKQDLSKLKQIKLIHLSNDYSHCKDIMKARVKKIVGIDVEI